MLKKRNRVKWAAHLARALNVSTEAVRTRVKHGSRLLALGLVKWEGNGTSSEMLDPGLPELATNLMREDFSLKKVIRSIASPPPPATLAYTDFPHLRETLGHLRRYLRSALQTRKSGVNIFLYGEPGTGKSELARVIAREMRAMLYEVSSEDDDGDANSGTHRLRSLRMAQSLLKNQRTILVFDEAEDVFRGASIFKRSLADQHKAWINTTLETNPVPTIWISNSGSRTGPCLRQALRFRRRNHLAAPEPAQAHPAPHLRRFGYPGVG